MTREAPLRHAPIALMSALLLGAAGLAEDLAPARFKNAGRAAPFPKTLLPQPFPSDDSFS